MSSVPRLSIRGPATLGLVASLALILGFGLWATTSRLSGAIVAPGQIEVESDRQVVQHPDGGVVEAILVADGARVDAGQTLIRLDGTALRSELAIIDSRLSELASSTARLLAERDAQDAPDFPADLVLTAQASSEVAIQLDSQRRLFRARRDTLDEQRALMAQRIDQVRAQANGIAAQQAAVAIQLDLIEQELSAQTRLQAKGLAQAGAVLALQREKARLQGLLGGLAAERARSDGLITEIEIEISALDTTRREDAINELRELAPLALELAERRRALVERIDRLEIRAPAAGVVLGLNITTPRAVLRSAEPVLFIIPQDRPLVISARIAPIHVDEVRPGQTAELVFPAFAARDTPHLTGTVTLVSAAALTDPQTGASYYTADIELAPGELARLADRALLPGMPVEVYLQTGQRSPMAYLTKPFTDYFSRAFRES